MTTAAVHQAYRFALDPTRTQRGALAAHCGAARFAFNWGLEQVKASMALCEFERCMFGEVRTAPLRWSLAGLRREWNRDKDRVAPWWAQQSKEAYSSGLAGLVAALQNWRSSRDGKRRGTPVEFPPFRKRGHRDSCRFTTGAIHIDGVRHVTLPRIGRLRTSESTEKLGRKVASGTARILSATLCRGADRWFVSFTCSVERAATRSNGHTDTVGIDLGVHNLAALSGGELVPAPKALSCALRALRRSQRVVARRSRGSRRRQRAQLRVARIHRRVANVRRHHLHVLSTRLAKNPGRLVIEDLNLKGMVRTGRGTVAEPGQRVRARSGQNRLLLDAGFGDFRRLLEYKSVWYGSRLLVADRWFPSSKRCSACGAVRSELARAERVFACAACSFRLDRDLNAARNLDWWAAGHDVAASAVETQNARRGAATIRPHAGEGLEEARTGIVPEPAGLTTGGRDQLGLAYVPC
ncbi:MAG: IS607 family element transposase accessory protein TnpB [Candidatus Dormibacteraeota bacterium]|nr:IS607 family element transposase accessory protein TnpB [Candidatus Dormibacteraeota bacterium]